MKIKIEKGILIPKKPNKYPFDKMEIGDSFFVDEKRINLYQHARKYKNENKKFAFTIKEEGTGVRIWRT